VIPMDVGRVMLGGVGVGSSVGRFTKGEHVRIWLTRSLGIPFMIATFATGRKPA
jgi:hypothetical protein